MSAAVVDELVELLACPLCTAPLAPARTRLTCERCRAEFPQASAAWIDLVPSGWADRDATGWHRRQSEMERWYADLARDPDEAHRCLSYDYDPLAGRLAALEGEVLDVGGGMGLTRHFLSPGTRYTVVDPSSAWLSARWHDVARLFPEPVVPARYVRGVGERLPFRTAAVDAVVALWSLNHVSDPAAVVAEIARVTRPGGRLIVVLEDVSADDGPPEPVTLQSDHIHVSESDFRSWLAGAFAVVRREWVRHYLSFDAVREGARSGLARTGRS